MYFNLLILLIAEKCESVVFVKESLLGLEYSSVEDDDFYFLLYHSSSDTNTGIGIYFILHCIDNRDKRSPVNKRRQLIPGEAEDELEHEQLSGGLESTVEAEQNKPSAFIPLIAHVTLTALLFSHDISYAVDILPPVFWKVRHCPPSHPYRFRIYNLGQRNG
jgi:hypothetical protein